MAGTRNTLGPTSRIHPAAEALRQAGRENPDAFVQTMIHIINKQGRDQLLEYRYGQRILAELIQKEEKAKRPVRIFDLKSRQIGKTTMVQSRNFVTALCTDGVSTVTVAHLQDRAADILRKAKYAYSKLPPLLQLPLSRDSKEGMSFAQTHSQQMIISAKNIEAVRSGTHQRVHLSEWPLYDDPELALYEVSQVCHMLPETSIIIEGTGRGEGSFAHNFWKRCRKRREIFIPRFFPWQDDPECSVIFKSDRDQDEQLKNAYEYAPELADRARLYNLTPGNIVWAANTLRDQAFGNWEKFLEDYPCDEHECWRSKGDIYFGAHNVAKLRQLVKNVKYDAYCLEHLHLETGFKNPEDLSQPINFDPINEDYPYIIIYARPQNNRFYVMGSDSASGRGDPSSTYILDMVTGEMMAEFHGVVQPHQHARVNVDLCNYYNTAKAGPECNEGYGMSMLNYMISYGYNNFYIWKAFDDTKYREGLKYGWYTGPKSRDIMLALARRVVEETAKENPNCSGLIRSARLVDEMGSFVEDERTGVPRASSGNNDDCVMGWSIAWIVAQQETKGMGSGDVLRVLQSLGEDSTQPVFRQDQQKDVKDMIALTMAKIREQQNIQQEDRYDVTPISETPESDTSLYGVFS